jgi:nitroreductase
MDVYKAIYTRRTVRDFKEKKIDMEIVRKILDAGMQAPSNNHMREWEFIIINDKKARLGIIGSVSDRESVEEAVRVIDEWGLTDRFQREMYIDAIPKQCRMLLNAGCVILPCFRHVNLLKPRSLSSLNSFASIWCCIENILLAAVDEGIYGVTRIPSDEEEAHLKRILNVPGDYEIPCYIALGYPNEDVNKIPQHSFMVEDKIHLNKW